ncbi:DUF6191 domain-containing protein [Streptomyces sp. NPDC014846]|uniref:DUF6191 domain-containing protein n=1 Tax=Streptomyces sp. NPDC014846 TaxID=3364922 RepID=UPI0036F9339B
MIVAATPFSVPWRARPGVRPLEDGAAGSSSRTAPCPGKQHELKERQSSLVLRDDEEDGAPPHRSTVDLRSGTAVIRVTPGRLRS